MARRRKPGRPKGSKNKRKVGRPRVKARTSAKKAKRKVKAKGGGGTAAQKRNLKKARAVLAANRAGKKPRKKISTKQAAHLRKARAIRELKNMPATLRMYEPWSIPSIKSFRVPPARTRRMNPHVVALYAKAAANMGRPPVPRKKSGKKPSLAKQVMNAVFGNREKESGRVISFEGGGRPNPGRHRSRSGYIPGYD